MAISCPNCGTAANVNGDARRAGRLVRCRKCGTAWFARSVEDDPYARRDTAIAGDMDGVSDAVVIDDAVPRLRLGRQRLRPRRSSDRCSRRSPQACPSASSVIATILAVGFVMLRAPLVAAFPQLNSAARTAGVEFRGITSETVKVGGGRTLIVQGQIVNTLATTVELPLVKIAIKGGDGSDLSTWVLQPAARLAPGQSIGFRSARASPPQNASEVTVSFAE